jgi:hypothetical protein
MSKTAESTYKVEELKCTDLLVDRRVQRDQLQPKKVDAMVANFNPDAVGVIHVSRRTAGDYIIDGWHRNEAKIRVTEGAGTITAHVYEGLTLAQEAHMFLALNTKTLVNPLDKHKARVSAEDEQAMRIEQHVHAYGWAVHPDAAPGHVNAIQKLYQLDEMSQNSTGGPRDPHILQLVFLTISRAWSNDRYASQSMILDGLGRLYLEHGSKIDTDHLVDRLKNYRGGPRKLLAESRQFANTAGGKVSMAVAWMVTELYNKGKKDGAKTALPPWRKRT